MGMHFGIIAARTSREAFVRALEPHGYRLHGFSALGPLAIGESDEDGFQCALYECADYLILIDTSFTASGDPDLVVDLARSTGKGAASCVGETGSGSFMFYSADAGGLRRGYSMCHADQLEPWSVGTALRSEADEPLDEGLDGKAFIKAFEELGFDRFESRWKEHWSSCLLDFVKVSRPTGEWALKESEFLEAHTVEETRLPALVKRTGGGSAWNATGKTSFLGSLVSRMFGNHKK